jgi:uncharacterized protein YndB with AHSA1/START domain
MKELSVTRYIAAPPEVVWDVMANRQEEWWCPQTMDRRSDRSGTLSRRTQCDDHAWSRW